MASPDDLKFQGKLFCLWYVPPCSCLCLSALIFVLLVSRVWWSRRSPVFKSWSLNPQHLQPSCCSLLWRAESRPVRRWRQPAREFRGELQNKTANKGTQVAACFTCLLVRINGISQFVHYSHSCLEVKNKPVVFGRLNTISRSSM